MKYLFSAIGLLGVCVLAVVCLGSDEIDAVQKEKPLALASTASIEVPSSVEFCGEQIDLGRYDLYERFDREITAVTYMHSHTLGCIKRANRYFPVLIPILEKNQIPTDFVYLSYIESDMMPRAMSGSKAAGLWQILPATGRQYGLEVNEFVDERFHPERATEAACKYFKDAYAKFGNWVDVANAYNAGIARISSSLSKQGAKSSLDLWVNQETYKYVMRIVAAKEMLKRPYRYGFVIKADQLYQPIAYREVKVSKAIPDLIAFAKEHETTYLHLKDANPWLVGSSLPVKPGKEYIVRIPLAEKLSYKTMPRSVYNSAWVVQ